MIATTHSVHARGFRLGGSSELLRHGLFFDDSCRCGGAGGGFRFSRFRGEVREQLVFESEKLTAINELPDNAA